MQLFMQGDSPLETLVGLAYRGWSFSSQDQGEAWSLMLVPWMPQPPLQVAQKQEAGMIK